MMVSITLSLENLQIIASMIPKSELLREEAMKAAIEFLGEVERVIDQTEEDADGEFDEPS